MKSAVAAKALAAAARTVTTMKAMNMADKLP
jgi:hypothetical protein